MEQKRKDKGAFIATLLLAIAGVVLSLLALQQHLFAKADPSYESFCDVSTAMSCSAVATSQYAQILGIPLASYGVVFYSVVAFISSIGAFTTFVMGGPLLILSLFAVGLSVYLFLISTLYIKALCLLCIGLYVVNILLLLVSLFIARGGIKGALSSGISSVIGYPKVLFGKDSAGSTAALVGFLFTIGVAVGTIQLPRLIGPAKKSARSTIAADVVTSAVNEWEGQKAISPASTVAEGENRDYFLGNPSAPVHIVEFSDFECPACQSFYPVLKGVIAKYKDKVHFVYKNYPLDMECNPAFKQPAHQNACFSAFAARCAGEQGKFWEATEVLLKEDAYHMGEQDAVRRELLRRLEGVGISLKDLTSCIDSGRHKDKILSEIQEADRYGLRGTPAVWVNGKKLSSLRADVLEAVVQRAAGGR